MGSKSSAVPVTAGCHVLDDFDDLDDLGDLGCL